MTEIQTLWSWLPAIYLFLGGLAGGTFLFSSLVRLTTDDKCSRLAVFAPWISFAALAIGLLCLVAEVEKPLQAMMMWQSFVNFGSWMTLGAWLLFVTIAVFGVCALFSTPRIRAALKGLWEPFGTHAAIITKVTMIIGSVLGFFVAVYTGILLGAAPAIPLWNSWLIPVLFTVSALDAGASVVIACLLVEQGHAKTVKATTRKLQIALLALIVLEAAVLSALLIQMSSGTVSEVLSASLMLDGALSLSFWVLVVAVGLGLPCLCGVIELTGVIKNKTISRVLHILAIACALIGGFTLRFIILSAGIHGAMVSPDPYQAILGIYQLIS